MIVFVAEDDDIVPYVWALPLSGEPTWARLAPTGVLPTGLIYHSAIYDPVRDRMIVFGGFAVTARSEVWALELSGSPAWHQLSPSGTPPPARQQHTAIYDPLRDRMIVFGGTNGSPLGDVWALDLADSTSWTQLTPAGAAPSARFGHAAVYDAAHDAMLVLGGSDGAA